MPDPILTPIPKRKLGRTSLEASALGLGTWSFGGRAYGHVEDRDATEVIETALDSGINVFDTASNYGMGRSEELLGKVLRRHRNQVIVCTKGGNGRELGRAIKRFDANFLDESLLGSLRRLRTDHVDIYLLHNPPVQVLNDGMVFDWLEKQKRAGKLLHWGISAYDNTEDVRLALDAGAELIEARYSLLRTDVLPHLGEDLARAQCGFIGRSPLGGGLLTGKYGPESRFDPRCDHRSRWSTRYLKSADDALEELSWLVNEGICDTVHEAAIRFAVHGQGVGTAIPGAKTRDQLLQNLRAATKGPLPEEALERIVETRERYTEEMGLH